MRCEAFSSAFTQHGVELDGRTFLLKLGALCGANAHGSLIDSKSIESPSRRMTLPIHKTEAFRFALAVVPLARRVAHSWHQDCGISSNTVLLGFPPRNGYVGGGVFSHHVKL